MSSRRIALLLLLALLLAAGALLFQRTSSEPPAIPLEKPPAPEGQAPARPRAQTEPAVDRTSVAATSAAPAPAEDLRAEGARRGWQLPIGKGWWLDTLVNPAGVEPAGAEIEALQEQVLRGDEQLGALRLQREQRLDAYCNERIAAGLACADPRGTERLPEGKQHVIVNTHSPEAPGRFWRVDVGAGDDAELDALDQQIASRWCAAVLGLRQRFASLKR